MNSKGTLRIVIAGDIIPSGKNIPLFESGYACQLFGKKICDLFAKADFSIVNLEGALTDSNKEQEKAGPKIKAPVKTILGLKNLEVKAVALANNHVTDYGQQGFLDTVHTLYSAGIDYVGAGACTNEVKTHLTVSVGIKKVCIYNVSEAFFNVPCANSAGVNLYDEWMVLNEIKELKDSHDYLIVIYHGGAEEFPYPTPLVKKRFHRMADCGADFITAQHTHCVGCYEMYNNSYLLYGQGNFLFARMKNEITKHGLVTVIDFKDDDVTIHHHSFTVNSDDVVDYDDIQDFSAFNMRSKELFDENAMYEKYKEYIYNFRLKKRTLKAFQGNTFFVRLLRRFLKKYYENTCLENYTKEQLLRIKLAIGSDRCSEDLSTLFTYMIEKKKS